MHVKMVLYAGPGGTAEIKSHIKAVRVVFLPEGLLANAGQIDHIVGFLRSGFGQRGDVTVCHHEEMAGGIGKQIQNNEGVPTPKQQQIFGIARFPQLPAENTLGR